MGTNPRTMHEAFGAHGSSRDAETGCMLWNGPISNGYGYFGFGGRGNRIRAHRAALIVAGVALDDAQVVMHKCDNPRCVNPDHLTAGTQSENNRDMRQKGRARPKTQADHCARGHVFTNENTMRGADGARRCRACHNERSLKNHHKRGALRFAKGE